MLAGDTSVVTLGGRGSVTLQVSCVDGASASSAGLALRRLRSGAVMCLACWCMCGRRLCVKCWVGIATIAVGCSHVSGLLVHVWTAPLRQVLGWHCDDCGRVQSCVWPVGACVDGASASSAGLALRRLRSGAVMCL